MSRSPIVQYTSHNSTTESALSEILNRAIENDQGRGDGSLSEPQETGGGFPYFIWSVDMAALDEENMESAETIEWWKHGSFAWIYGEEEFGAIPREIDIDLINKVLRGDFVFFMGNYYFLAQQPEGADRVYMAGVDDTDFRISFRDGIISLETLLAIAFLSLCVLFSKGITRLFKPMVENLIEQNKFIGDASHELKTPLAVIRADTELLASSPETTDFQRTWLSSIDSQTRSMQTTIENLVELSSLNSSLHPTKDEDMSALINECCLALDAVCFERGISYDSSDIEPGIRVLCNSGQVKRLVEELLNNAAKYATGNPPEIKVHFHMGRTRAELRVENTGSTISPEEKERIFDRFYRTDATRAGETEGSGLGLFLCRSICEKNHFTITCEPELGVKTTFVVSMPLD